MRTGLNDEIHLCIRLFFLANPEAGLSRSLRIRGKEFLSYDMLGEESLIKGVEILCLEKEILKAGRIVDEACIKKLEAW